MKKGSESTSVFHIHSNQVKDQEISIQIQQKTTKDRSYFSLSIKNVPVQREPTLIYTVISEEKVLMEPEIGQKKPGRVISSSG